MNTFPVFIMDHDSIHESFYLPFKGLTYMGLWSFKSDNAYKRIFYFIYEILVLAFAWQIVILGFVDLYINWNDIRRVIFNSCTTVFTLAVTIKNMYSLNKSSRIDVLRIHLYQDSQAQRDDEEVEILRKFQKTLIAIEMMLFIIFLLFYPFWLLSSLMSLKWGPRELPFPVWLPLDLEDNLQFSFGFIYHTLGGTFVVAEAALADLALYSLLLQTTGQYAILKSSVLKVNELYSTEARKENNKYLLQLTLRTKFKKFLKRQLELNQYVAELEGSYNLVMLMQLVGGLILAVGNGLELLLVLNSFNIKVIYQFAFFFVILCDLLICCALGEILVDECRNINKALYSLAWYEMENGNRKDILLMIMGTQKTPTLTVGKLMPLNLRTYLGFIRNLYSWVALFRQIVMKK